MGCADNQVVRCNDSGSAYEIQEYCSASTCVVEGANASCTGLGTGGTSGTGGFYTGGTGGFTTGGTGGYTGGTGGTSGTGGIVNNCASTTNPGIASFDSWYPYTTNTYYGYTADSRTVYAQFGDDSGYGTGELVSPGATTVSTYAAHLTTPSAYAGATIQITFDLCLNASSWSTGLFWYSHESGPVTVVLYDSLGYSYVYTYAANAGWYLHQVPWTSFAPSFPPQDLDMMEFDVAGAGQVDMWLDDVQYY
jgi:hypothetical protein